MGGIQKFDATPVRPSTPAYAPGTVAVATVDGVPNVRVFRIFDSNTWEPRPWRTAKVVNGRISHHDAQVTDVRPLVAIDLDAVHARAGVSNIVARLRRLAETGNTLDYACTNDIVAEIADQIEQQTRPPKPPEPGKYGAVIAGDGREWHRYTTREANGFDWIRADSASEDTATYARWEDLDVLRVTNEGNA